MEKHAEMLKNNSFLIFLKFFLNCATIHMHILKIGSFWALTVLWINAFPIQSEELSGLPYVELSIIELVSNEKPVKCKWVCIIVISETLRIGYYQKAPFFLFVNFHRFKFARIKFDRKMFLSTAWCGIRHPWLYHFKCENMVWVLKQFTFVSKNNMHTDV